MREIKFRAMWQGHWFYFSLDELATAGNPYGSGKSILLTHLNESKYRSQYTGLKDKNGAEIYEDDIVLVEDADQNDKGEYISLPSRVVYDEGCFVIFPKNDDELLMTVNDRIAVIGNIYENPDLLQQGNAA